MARPSSSVLQIVAESKGHRTKPEIDYRKEQEEKLKSKKTIQCKFDKKNPVNAIAAKEFNRLVSLMKAIDKNDAVYENSLSRYAMLFQECVLTEQDIIRWQGARDVVEESGFELAEKLERMMAIEKTLSGLDCKLMKKREAMLRIEKENALTIAAALRAIPKQPKKEQGSETDDLF